MEFHQIAASPASGDVSASIGDASTATTAALSATGVALTAIREAIEQTASLWGPAAEGEALKVRRPPVGGAGCDLN